MKSKLTITSLSSVLSDKSRVTMISALIDGRSLTANELAHGAGITPQTATFHLKKLVDAEIVRVSPSGRHRFFSLASPKVEDALRTLMNLAPDTSTRPAAKRKSDVCFARTCYGHLAGCLGIAIAQAVEEKGYVQKVDDRDYSLTKNGEHFLLDFGIDLSELRKSRRRFASQCLDWSERKPHVGGIVGLVLTNEFKRRDWIRTRKAGREVSVTPSGHRGFKALLGVDVGKLSKIFFVRA